MRWTRSNPKRGRSQTQVVFTFAGMRHSTRTSISMYEWNILFQQCLGYWDSQNGFMNSQRYTTATSTLFVWHTTRLPLYIFRNSQRTGSLTVIFWLSSSIGLPNWPYIIKYLLKYGARKFCNLQAGMSKKCPKITLKTTLCIPLHSTVVMHRIF